STDLPLSADGGQITGYVFNDLSGDGTRDGAEGNLANQHLYLDANDNAQQDAGELSVKTRANGKFTFSGVPAGTYFVRISPSAGLRSSAPAPSFSYKVKLIRGASAVGKKFGLTPKVQIKGTVFNDGNANGTQDPGELGREGFTVWLDSNM